MTLTPYFEFTGPAAVAAVAKEHGRRAAGVELNPDYCDLAVARYQDAPAPSGR